MKAALLFALALAVGAPAFADAPPAPANRFAATIVPAERFDSGAVLVERHGQHGRPLILIPGLASGAWVWQDLVRELSPEHVVYVVTLPGFDGRPAAGNGLEAARKGLLELISSRKLDKPVLVGHSLGGTLALALAEQNPGLIGGVVSVDGLPVFPGTEEMPAEQRLAMAEDMKKRMARITPAGFASQQQQYMRGVGVIDMGMADELAQLTERSDPAAVAQYVGDVLALDLRPGLARISAPMLVVAPYFEPDAGQDNVTEAKRVEYYKSLMAGAPKAEVVALAPARHFAMFDQPARLAEIIRNYLNKL
jgi:pimeloyl-ACP methyl ester carboxylesterase